MKKAQQDRRMPVDIPDIHENVRDEIDFVNNVMMYKVKFMMQKGRNHGQVLVASE